MKTKFFRNTAPVIPTGAKRSGGISQLTHDATIKAGAHVRRCLGKLGMTVAGAALLLPLLRRGLGGGFLGKLGMTVVLLSPVGLAAQNGVTVSNLNVNTGTVTFDVRWGDNPLPPLWSDTVWVFVDYNDAGVMQRLQLTGATLTNPSWEAASITRPNDQGAWVIGNAKTADLGSFSATVQLLTATADIAGACAYASNYPPEAEYINIETIKFTGTPPYDLVLQLADASTVTRQSGDLFNPVGQTLQSFTDKTGAPGIVKCSPFLLPTVTSSSGTDRCGEGTVTLTATASDGAMIDWYDVEANGTVLTGGSATNSYTTPTLSTSATYYAQAKHSSDGCVSALPRTAVVATVIPNPVITTQPAARSSVCPGTTVTLEVVASPATAYQWMLNGTATTEGSGYNSATYTTAALPAATTYTVVVANGSCSVTSDVALVSMQKTGCNDFVTGCTGFTQISSVDSEGAYSFAAGRTYCANKDNGIGWRVPDYNELSCLCSKKASLAHGYINGDYWSSSAYTYDFDTYYIYIKMGDCKYGDDYQGFRQKHIKCVK